MKKCNFRFQRFGRLTALRPTDMRRGGHIIWVCYCICGTIVEVCSNDLSRGDTRSCGCLKHKHGEWGTRLYKIYKNMKQRCLNINNPIYKYYGGRGIKICSEWLNNYIVFSNWARASGYHDNLTIDRIDNEKGYFPENCQFITQSENTRKRYG